MRKREGGEEVYGWKVLLSYLSIFPQNNSLYKEIVYKIIRYDWNTFSLTKSDILSTLNFIHKLEVPTCN